MKWLALLLVIANVAFFGWRYEMRLRHAEKAELPAAPLPAHTPSLTLITELGELPPLRESAHAESANAQPAVPVPPELPVEAPAPVPPGTTVTDNASPASAPTEAAPSAENEEAVTETAEAPPDSSAAAAETATASAAAESTAAVTATSNPTDTPPASPETAASAPARPSLLTESPEPPTIAAREATAKGVPSDVCVNVGPFPDARHADTVEAWLAPRATSLYRVNQVIRRRQFFWVYLEPKNAAEAAARVADLERKGVRDYLLIQRGGLENAISLGLFSTQDAVNRRLAEMSQQGFNPVVVPRVEVTDYDWIRATLAVGFTDTTTLPRDALAGAAVQPIDCARIAEPDPSP